MNFFDYFETAVKKLSKTKTIVVFPGGFQPPHKGHLKTYRMLQQHFPNAEVYVYTSNDTTKRPFNFQQKKALWNAAGVSKVIKSSGTMYSAKQFLKDANINNPEKVSVVFAVSDKEAGRLSQVYYKNIDDKKHLEPVSQIAYRYIISKPDEDQQELSGTKIREAIIDNNTKKLNELLPYSIEVLKKNLPESMKHYNEDDSSAMHYLHLEQLATTHGGIERAIEIIDKITDDINFENRSIKVDFKIDGSPSFIAGIDPSDKKFFVAYKGALASKTPKLFKKEGDSAEFLAEKEELANVFEALFKYLKPIIRKNIYQGDVMFVKGTSKSQKQETIDGEKCVTFYPNTIKYVIPASSASLYKEISNAKIGVGFHTKLSGKNISSLSPKFGVELQEEGLKSTSNVFMMDANIRNITSELKAPTQLKAFIKTRIAILKNIASSVSEEDYESIKPFINSIEPYVNSIIKNPNLNIDSTVKKMIDNVKEKSKQGLKSEKAQNQREEIVSKNQVIIRKILIAYKILWQIKTELVKYFNSLSGKMKTMMKMPNGEFKVSPLEGFVAINTGKNRVVKLVDRLNFSRMNFVKNND